MDARHFQAIKHLFEFDSNGNVIFNSNLFNPENFSQAPSIHFSHSRLNFLNTQILCKEEKQIKKPLALMFSELMDLINKWQEDPTLEKLAYIFNMSALVTTYRGQYQKARVLCKMQIARIKKITECYGYDDPCVYYYQPLINMARLDLIEGKIQAGQRKFNKLFSTYLNYITNSLHPKLTSTFAKDNTMIHVIASASLYGIFNCLIRLADHGKINQYSTNLHPNGMMADLVRECHLISSFFSDTQRNFVILLDKYKKEFAPSRLNIVFFREAQYFYLLSDMKRSIALFERLFEDCKQQFQLDKNIYHLFFINQIAIQIKKIGDQNFYLYLMKYLSEAYQSINDEVGSISSLIALNSPHLSSHIKNSDYVFFDSVKQQMGLSTENPTILTLENSLLNKLNDLEETKYAS